RTSSAAPWPSRGYCSKWARCRARKTTEPPPSAVSRLPEPTMKGSRVFRQAVLDRLASPEQLHTLMQVTDAKGWVALLGCFLLLAAAAVWGIFGRIPTKVEASGILLFSGGLADVVALGSGQISALEVEVGDAVSKGQVIAEVAQPELAEQIRALKA